MFNILKIYIILSILSLLCCSCISNKANNFTSRSFESEKKVPGQNEVQKFLGLRCLDIIGNPEKVESYQIDWKQQSKNVSNIIHGYPVIQKGRSLDYHKIKAVNKIINSPSSYDFKWSKRIRIRPSYVLRFIRQTEKVDIAIDFNTRQWAFYHDNKIMIEDISKPANAALRNIIANLF